MFKQLKEATAGFDKCENWEINIPYKSTDDSAHRVVIENFADAILDGKAPVDCF